jgi:hypothetical protein
MESVIKADLCGMNLTGAAARYFSSLPRGPHKHSTWDQFAQTLMAFDVPEKTRAAKAKLFQLKQTGTVQNYINEHNILFVESGSQTSEQDRIKLFHEGLKNPTIADTNPATNQWWTSITDLQNFVRQRELTATLSRNKEGSDAAQDKRVRFARPSRPFNKSVGKPFLALATTQGFKERGRDKHRDIKARNVPGNRDTRRTQSEGNKQRKPGGEGGKTARPTNTCAGCSSVNWSKHVRDAAPHDPANCPTLRHLGTLPGK